MKRFEIAGLIAGLMLAAGGAGCRALPSSYAMMVVGDIVSDIDVKDRQAELMGKTATVADAMFGKPSAILVDPRRDRRLIVYPVKGDLLGKKRFVVELVEDRIVALSKTTENIDGAEDIIKAAALRDKLLKRTPSECRRAGDFDRPVLVLRDQNTWNLVHVYDVRNITNLRGARYCVLKFDADNRCQEVKLVGVAASTKDDPAGG